MIDQLLNDIWGWGQRRSDVLIVVFLGTGLNYYNAYLSLRGQFEK